MLVLTNCTFDGHIYNVERVMQECLAIKPDLIFLWDEAWFGFARFSPFYRRRTAMGAAAILEKKFQDPSLPRRLQGAGCGISARTWIRRTSRFWIWPCCPIRTRSASASIKPIPRTSPCRPCGRDRWSW